MAFNLNTVTIPDLSLSRGKGSALYVQLAKELENFIASGTLKSGDRLPSERELAKQLGLSRTTVVNSYQELESRIFSAASNNLKRIADHHQNTRDG